MLSSGLLITTKIRSENCLKTQPEQQAVSTNIYKFYHKTIFSKLCVIFIYQ
jgi:hypothetical protein